MDNPTNSQNLNQIEESCCFAFQDCWVENYFSLGFNNGCLAEGQTEAAMCVKWWLKKFDLTILKRVTCLGFSNTEEFYKD